jgi:serine/threonine-protein kinase
LPVRDAVDYVLEACEALEEAHRAGIAHRDLKPANFLYCRKLTGESTIKLLDFGLLQRPSNPPLNLSPEQLGAALDLDHRSDIWSLGTVLFELVTGQPVWRAPTASELVLQITHDPPPSMQDIEPSIPEGFSAIVHRCLEKDPAQRYQCIGDLAAALAPFGGSRSKASLGNLVRPPVARAPVVARTEAPRGGNAHVREARQAPEPARRSRMGPALVVLALMALTAFGGVRWWARGTTHSELIEARPEAAPSAVPTPLPVNTAAPVPQSTASAAVALTASALTASAAQTSAPPLMTRKPKSKPAASARPDCNCGPATPQLAPKSEPTSGTSDPFSSRL